MNQETLQSKIALVEEVADKMSKSGSGVVVEYRGLTVAEVTELRRALRAENVELKVYKNSTVERAAQKAGYEGLSEYLTGPNAIALSEDSVAPARVLCKFAKKHDKLVVKGGFAENKVVDAETVKTLSKLPDKNGMISMLLGCLQAPIIKFACAAKAVGEAKEGKTEA